MSAVNSVHLNVAVSTERRETTVAFEVETAGMALSPALITKLQYKYFKTVIKNHKKLAIKQIFES